jgi:excisionase family DNA binding protein
MDLLTVKEAADLLKLSAGAVYALCKSGTLPHHRLGQGRGAIRIDRQDLLAYVEACRTGTGAAPVTRGGVPQPVPETPAPKGRLPVGGFKHLRVDRLLGGQPPADGPSFDRGESSAR